jgi:hypothetical protein
MAVPLDCAAAATKLLTAGQVRETVARSPGIEALPDTRYTKCRRFFENRTVV